MSAIDIFFSLIATTSTAVAATAAWLSYRTSQAMKEISQQSALMSSHTPASAALTDILEKLIDSSEKLDGAIARTLKRAADSVEAFDDRAAGGKDPRPIRHVLFDTAESLLDHASGEGSPRPGVHSTIFEPVRRGPIVESDEEFNELLSIADGTYTTFESTFGPPDCAAPVYQSRCFRWGMYQLQRRISEQDWLKQWRDFLCSEETQAYKIALTALCPGLTSARRSLQKEQKLLLLTPYPLAMNERLNHAYSECVSCIEILMEDVDLDSLGRVEWKHGSDIPGCIVYSVATVFLARDTLERLRSILSSTRP